ncbi:signal-regulatory protein beta-2-like [Chaetodon auriga]|uniref:signal-regulatory protein beta-2-like n=1 Tax=Chaetodon auriga TaxID=39042 RepID=UPI004032DA61
MIGSEAALILLSTLCLSQTTDISPQMPLTVAELGANVTLTCQISGDDSGLFYWYKMNFGYMVQTVAGGALPKISPQGQFNNARFTVTNVNTVYTLNIKNVSKEDEATYFCQGGTVYVLKFLNATVLAVNDHKNQQKSVYVKQSPETESVKPGGSMTLQCSLLSRNKDNTVQCPGEHSVYWFRAGSGGSHPSIIYTNSSDEEEERSCVYSLSQTVRDSSDTGTYYCAVVTCGQILFGEGTQVETREELCPLVIVLGTLLTCCVIVIVALIMNQKPVCGQCKREHAEHDRSAEAQPNNLDGEAASNYVTLAFPSRKRER